MKFFGAPSFLRAVSLLFVSPLLAVPLSNARDKRVVISWNGKKTSPSPFAKSLQQTLRRRSRSAGTLCATISSRAVPFRRIA